MTWNQLPYNIRVHLSRKAHATNSVYPTSENYQWSHSPVKQIRKEKLLGTRVYRVYCLSVQLNPFAIIYRISPMLAWSTRPIMIQLPLQLIPDHTLLTVYTLENQICFYSLHEHSISPLRHLLIITTPLESYFCFFSFINSYFSYKAISCYHLLQEVFIVFLNLRCSPWYFFHIF